MSTKELKAWILHKKYTGTTNLRIMLFTEEKGIVNCFLHQGAAAKKQALTQPFTPLWVFIKEKNGWFYVSKIEAYHKPLQFQGQALFAALYLNELIYYSLKENDSYPELFDLYSHTVKALHLNNDKLVLETLLRQFEFALLEYCGYALPCTYEASTPTPIIATKHYSFIAGLGFTADPNGKILGKKILACASGRFNDIDALKTAKVIMRQAIDHFLQHRELKTRSLLAACERQE